MLKFRNLSVGYGHKIVLSGLCENFERGEFVALVGRNGAGKSTLLRTAAGLAKPLGGEVLIDGVSIEKLPRRDIARLVSLVSTEPVRVHNLSVEDMVALGRSPHTGWLGRLSDEDQLIVTQAIELVGLRDFSARMIENLSDGERQRALIARALAQGTPVILLDEATAFLDHWARREVSELLARLAHEQGKTILFSSHDLALVDELADRTFEITPSPK